MGGPGSGRWTLHTARRTTGASLRIYPKSLRSHIAQAEGGSLARGGMGWNCNGEPSGNIRYQIEKRGADLVLRLIYTVTPQGAAPVPYDYPVLMTSTKTAWGALRWWFTCPAAGCGRRVGVLYLPPGAQVFACRHCHNLTYQTCLDAHKMDGLYKRIPGLEDYDRLLRDAKKHRL